MMRWLALIFMGLSAPLQAQDTAPDAAMLQAIAERIDAVPGMDTLFAACPADIFATRSGWFDGVWGAEGLGSRQACADDPGLCAQECLQDSIGRSCVYLAQVFEDAEPDIVLDEHTITARKAHVLACALGRAGGCTNRGGGIRNWPLDDDPFASMAPQARDLCLSRTFEVACAADDAWGCAMSGQSLAQGEGGLADTARARTQFRRACLLVKDPTFEACTFAKSAEAALDGN